jgi:erythronate-4-phosphate dehydrogenase
LSKKVPIIYCDQDIPYLADWLSAAYCVISYSADQLSAHDLATADGLIVRSVTPVTAELLKSSSCRWVGSVTAGINHLDTDALDQMKITWNYAPGANAPAVCEYVSSALFLAYQNGHLKPEAIIGVIGVGAVGSRVVNLCQQLGFQVMPYDPPRQEREKSFLSARWEDLVACDFIVVSAAYTQSGRWPSHELISAKVLLEWSKLCGLINVARGEIIDYSALLAEPLWTCLDVWPNEPCINQAWVESATLATPHIAGYSEASKWRLSAIIYQECCQFFNEVSQEIDSPSRIQNGSFADTVGLEQLSGKMKAAIAKENASWVFHALRKQYPLRSGD